MADTLALGTGHLTDGDFVRDFEMCLVSNTDFHHSDHIRLGWIFLRLHPLEPATSRMIAAIKRFAIHNHGDTGMFHETITRLWMRLISDRISADEISFAEFAARNPELLEKNYMFEFYSPATLMSAAARAHWVEPDLKPLP